jgi:hypothetical protein
MILLPFIANVILPGVLGFVMTIWFLLPLGMAWIPTLDPTAAAMIPVTGLTTLLVCTIWVGLRRAFVLVRRRITA